MQFAGNGWRVGRPLPLGLALDSPASRRAQSPSLMRHSLSCCPLSTSTRVILGIVISRTSRSELELISRNSGGQRRTSALQPSSSFKHPGVRSAAIEVFMKNRNLEMPIFKSVHKLGDLRCLILDLGDKRELELD